MIRNKTGGTTLRAAEIARCRSLLSQRQSILRAALRESVGPAGGPGRESSSTEVHDLKDEAFAGQLANMRGMARDQVESELVAIGAALHRLIEGGYGRCEDCGREIGHDRLLAQPSAARCLSCQEDAEDLRSMRSRA